MAEIKSTMEMVLARAARFEAMAAGDNQGREAGRDGMRAAAAFLNGGSENLEMRADDRDFLQGAVRALLRNITLPRGEEQLGGSERAMAGLVQIGGGDGELLGVLGDLKKVLDQYLAHRSQVREQLEAGFASQMAQLEGDLARQTGMSMQMKPSQHPKFQEEWLKVLDQLNSRYGQAVDQHKQRVAELLTGG